MEILRLHIDIKKTFELRSGDKAVRMVLFGGFCSGDYFKGKILDGAVDTQLDTLLSARYMLEGIDCDGKHCRLFVENNSARNSAETKPVIFTDSDALKWLEAAELRGEIKNGDRLEISICS